MTHFTSSTEIAILNLLLRGQAMSSPGNVYLGLIADGATQADLEAGNMTAEITGYDGDRPQITFDAPQVAAEGGHFCEHNTVLEYENMDASTVAFTFLSNSPNKGQGTMLTWQPVVDQNGNPITRSVEQGGLLRVSPGDARFRLD